MQTTHSILNKISGFRMCIIVVRRWKHKENKRSPSRCVLLSHFGAFFKANKPHICTMFLNSHKYPLYKGDAVIHILLIRNFKLRENK